ncbi:MAG TPA: hypothetical protein VG013_01830 [Gemmataceae bacterium]|nr:hypothetical protein [Gemmataceae bacterium]
MRMAMCALAVIVPAWMVLRAADGRAPRTTGHVLVLENERILEGDITRDGDEYRVRRSIGETCVPAETVLCLCADMEEAYRYLHARANLRDPDERLRLARWCQLHGLRTQALTEVTAAVELRPGHAESRRMLHLLQHPSPTATSRVPQPREISEPIVPGLEVTSESLGLFATHVQPILMNTCANCHTTGRGGAFKLTRAFAGTNRRATRQNLAAVLGQINREHPQGSPLLVKALSIHGRAEQPPLKNRDTPAYRALEEWVHLELADSQPADTASPLAVLSPTDSKAAEEPRPSKPDPAPAAAADSPKSRNQKAKPSAAAVSSDQWAVGRKKEADKPAGPVDPFDPIIFNQQVHPSQDQETAK